MIYTFVSWNNRAHRVFFDTLIFIIWTHVYLLTLYLQSRMIIRVVCYPAPGIHGKTTSLIIGVYGYVFFCLKSFQSWTRAVLPETQTRRGWCVRLIFHFTCLLVCQRNPIIRTNHQNRCVKPISRIWCPWFLTCSSLIQTNTLNSYILNIFQHA